MRVPSVVPRYAVAVGSLKECRGGTAIGKTPEERGKLNLELHDGCFFKERAIFLFYIINFTCYFNKF